MKFLHSPSSSSSTSETRPNYSAIGCIPAILRRLLCSHALPTFPLDNHITESIQNYEFKASYCDDEVKGAPGIVAKLMGLDSMPAENRDGKLRGLKLRKKGGCVLEAPRFVELEDDKFIVLSFEGGGKDRELKLNCSKARRVLIESKEEKRIGEDQESEVISSCKLSNLGNNSKRLCDKREMLRNKKFEKDETESDSENSSPVSVLEFSDHQEAEYSGKEELKLKNSNSRRKLREDLDKNAPSTSSSSSSPRASSCNSLDDDEESCRNGKQYEKKNVVMRESWEEICKMAARDVMDPSSSRVQMERWKGQLILEEICVCFESQILDQLILELLTIT